MQIVVIGARAAGLKAACRAKRLLPQADVTVLDEGQHISFAAGGLPYFLSGDVEDFRQLVTTPYNVERTPDYFASARGVRVLTGIRAQHIDPESRKVLAKEVESGKEATFTYDALVIATGVAPVIPPVKGVDTPGVNTFTRPEDAMDLRRVASSNQLERVAILGAGYVGCQLCEAFGALWGIKTALFDSEAQVLPQMLDAEVARIAELELQRQGVELHLKIVVTEILNEGDKLNVSAEDGENFADFDRIVIAAGVTPRTDLAREAGIQIGPTGGIVTDQKMRTNIPNIYAAGDCVESICALTGQPRHLPLDSIANRMGRVAANSIAGKDDAFGPVVGASALKVFDMNVAAVGLTAQAAREASFDVGQSWGFFTDKPDYYPEFENVSAKMVFDRPTQRILGVQAASKGEAVRWIDAATTLIREGMTLRRICDHEHAYAPPYSEALDPLHFLSYAGISAVEEKLEAFPPLELERQAADSVVIDIREDLEIEKKPFSLHCKKLLTIPFPQLRSRISEIPRAVKLTVVCPRGSRSNEAARLLRANGFDNVQYMGGGLGFFNA